MSHLVLEYRVSPADLGQLRSFFFCARLVAEDGEDFVQQVATAILVFDHLGHKKDCALRRFSHSDILAIVNT